MKSKLIIIFLSAFIINIGNLDAFAMEEKTQIIKSIDKSSSEIYKVENTPNIFLSENTDNFSISFRNEDNNSNFNENAWLWSFLFPGLGQYAMSENNSGTLFLILGCVTTLLTLTVALLGFGLLNREISGFIILIVGGPITLLANLTVYIISIINAYFLSEQKKSSNIRGSGRKRA